jgi:hypothetical protein
VTLAYLVALAGGLPAGSAGAQEKEVDSDARLEGYGEKLVMDSGNNAMTWLGFGFLTAVTLLGLFKDAKRSHLD